ALSYAELGTRITKSGGHYIYILETLANSAVVALAFGRYILEPFFAPCPTPLLAVKLVALLGYYIVLILNSWSVSWSARLQTILSIIKLAALSLIIVPGMMLLAQGCTENFQDAFNTQALVLDKLPLAFYAGMFAYSGWFQTSFVREELVKPERNIPLAVIVSVITVIVGYMLTNVSYYTVLTAADVLVSQAVAVSFARKAFQSLISVIPILVSLSCFGTMNGGIFTFSRTLFVASREGQWPTLFSMIHIQRHTPLPAVLLMFPLVTAMICVGDLYHLLNFFSFSRWLFIGLATLGLIVHRCRHPDILSPFKVPLLFPFPLLSSAFSQWECPFIQTRLISALDVASFSYTEASDPVEGSTAGNQDILTSPNCELLTLESLLYKLVFPITLRVALHGCFQSGVPIPYGKFTRDQRHKEACSDSCLLFDGFLQI
ncbi:putative Cystine-glutamate transporter-like protein, partial [Naja naja]